MRSITRGVASSSTKHVARLHSMKLKQLHLIQTRGLSSSKKRYDLDRLIAISALFPAPPSHTGSVGPIAYFCFAARLPRRFWRLSAKSAGSVRSCTPFSTGCRRKNVSPRSSSQRRLDARPLSIRLRPKRGAGQKRPIEAFANGARQTDTGRPNPRLSGTKIRNSSNTESRLCC